MAQEQRTCVNVRPGKEQSAKIAREKITEIFNLFPLLKKEIIGDGNYGKDYVDNLTYVLVTG